MMPLEVYLTAKAREDVEQCRLWWSNHRSAEQAVRWHAACEQALDSLPTRAKGCPRARESRKAPIELRQLVFGVGRHARTEPCLRFAPIRSSFIASSISPRGICRLTTSDEFKKASGKVLTMRISQILLGILLLGGGLSCRQALGQAPPVKLSKETTFITEPLADDGLPNYALAAMNREREGLTDDNNGARLFWLAMGTDQLGAELDEKHFNLLRKALNLDQPKSPYLIEVTGDEATEAVAEWLLERRRPGTASSTGKQELSEAIMDEAGEWVGTAMERPWTTEDMPPLAALTAKNEHALNLLVEAAAKPRFFSPPPNLLADPHTPVMELLLPHAQAARCAARGLSVRAMNRVAHHDYDKAWEDILAIWRLGAQMDDCPCNLEKLVAMAFRHIASTCTLSLLQNEDVSTELAAKILADLQTQPSTVDMVDAINYCERLMFLDTALRQVTDRLGGVALAGDGKKTSSAMNLDPNIVLRIGNQWFDRLVEASAIEDLTERYQTLEEIEADLEKTAAGVKAKTLLGGFSSVKRAEDMGEMLVSLMLPATQAAIFARDRDQTNLVLIRVAAALAVHRAKTGNYPDKLDELTPAVISTVPPDPFSGQPLIYAPRGDGYLLYSVYGNGVDDRGTDFAAPIIDGEWVAPSEHVAPDENESDFVLRVPVSRPPWVAQK